MIWDYDKLFGVPRQGEVGEDRKGLFRVPEGGDKELLQQVLLRKQQLGIGWPPALEKSRLWLTVLWVLL